MENQTIRKKYTVYCTHMLCTDLYVKVLLEKWTTQLDKIFKNHID